jgi:glycosyltransferase involved in cell wall biosynthesis
LLERNSSMSRARQKPAPYIYIACPWTPVGGGMFKVADYLIQAQALEPGPGFARLRPLDTRGGGSALLSIGILASALAKLVRGRLSGRLAGVHVNMAERLSLFRKGVVIIAARVLGLPVVLHLHAAQLHHFYRDLPPPLRSLTRWVFSIPRACIVLGAAARQFVTQELGAVPERVEIVLNGVPEPTVERRRTRADQVQNILFVGNLSERKGVSDLLRALALMEFPRQRLVVHIAGGGDIESYRRLAADLGLEPLVRFVGWVDQQQVAHLLALADLLVLPSYDEGLPLVILEAMAYGVAVVCTPVGEIPSVFVDGREVRFVTPGDAPSIAAGLQAVLNDPGFRQTLEANGRHIFQRQFSLSRFFEHIAFIHKKYFGICGELGDFSPAKSGTTLDK